MKLRGRPPQATEAPGRLGGSRKRFDLLQSVAEPQGWTDERSPRVDSAGDNDKAGDSDQAGDYTDGREMATTGAEHVDADRGGWCRDHQWSSDIDR